MTLCERCQYFDIQSFVRDPYGLRRISMTSLRQGKNEGCEFCSLLIAEVSSVEPGEVSFPEPDTDSSSYLWMTIHGDTGTDVKSRWSLFESGLDVNRLNIWIDDRNWKGRSFPKSETREICLAADEGWHISSIRRLLLLIHMFRKPSCSKRGYFGKISW